MHFCYSLETLPQGFHSIGKTGKHRNWVIETGGREYRVGLGILGEKWEIVWELANFLMKPVKYCSLAAMLLLSRVSPNKAMRGVVGNFE